MLRIKNPNPAKILLTSTNCRYSGKGWSDMTDKTEKKDKKQKRGLYFALAVCLVAIAIAGAATYSSVMDYVKSDDTSSAASSSVTTESETSYAVNDGEANAEPEISDAENAGTTVSQAEESTVEDASSDAEESAEEPSSEDAIDNANTETYTPSDSLKYPLASQEVVSAFSSQLIYNPVMKDYRTHKGMDIKSEIGETVKSIGNGVVKSTRTDLLLGNVIEIEHGDYTALYCGLGDTFLVKEGDIVTEGTAIGSVYSVPFENNEAAHLHLEITKNGESVDPAEILSKEP